MKEKRNRKDYTDEIKHDAVRLVTEQGYSCNEVARRLGINQSNVSRWVREYPNNLDSPQTAGSARELEAEVKRLRKENKRLLMEREILKKRRPSLPKNPSKIRFYPAANEGLSRHRTVCGHAGEPERVL